MELPTLITFHLSGGREFDPWWRHVFKFRKNISYFKFVFFWSLSKILLITSFTLVNKHGSYRSNYSQASAHTYQGLTPVVEMLPEMKQI